MPAVFQKRPGLVSRSLTKKLGIFAPFKKQIAWKASQTPPDRQTSRPTLPLLLIAVNQPLMQMLIS